MTAIKVAVVEGTVVAKKIQCFDWLGKIEWRCPKCEAVAMTSEASPRCRRCGFQDVGD
jgi:hypothetical protein